MSEIDDVRQSLRRLGRRLADGEIDEATYDRLRERLLADLTPAERAELGVSGTPAPATPAPGATLHPATPFPPGPSGGRGKGLRTRVASLSDLDLGPGTVLFDQWRIERELGRGGFGVVVEAEELTLRERQAVKVLDPAMVAREDLLERFRREVKATRKLVHPRIVRVFDYRENLPDGLALFSMEYVRGCSVQLLLAAARESGQPVPVPLALAILAQVLEALEAAHAQGVIHRDVTPANILLAGGTAKELLTDPSRDPQVKLVDFGIAGALERSELSEKSRVLGTAAYVAPEVLDPRVDVTPAADVYGAGAVFYELLTGKAPLGRFPDPSRVRPDLVPRVDALSLSLLETEPAARPTASQARQAADEALLGEARDRDERRLRRAERKKQAEAAARAAEEAARAEQAREVAGRGAEELAARQGHVTEQARQVVPSPRSVPASPMPAPVPRPVKPTSAAGPIAALGVALGVVAVIGWLAWKPPRREEPDPTEFAAVVAEPETAAAAGVAPDTPEAAPPRAQILGPTKSRTPVPTSTPKPPSANTARYRDSYSLDLPPSDIAVTPTPLEQTNRLPSLSERIRESRTDVLANPSVPQATPMLAGPLWVQVLVSQNAEKCDALAKRLKADGFRPDISLVPGKKGLFRVRVGPYPDRERAEAGARKLEKLEKVVSAVIVPGSERE